MLSAGFLIQKIMRRGLISDLHHSQSKLVSKKAKKSQGHAKFSGPNSFQKSQIRVTWPFRRPVGNPGIGAEHFTTSSRQKLFCNPLHSELVTFKHGIEQIFSLGDTTY
jgi:hypothetical protein